MKNDRVYLLHILKCIRRVEEDTAGGKHAFLASHTLQDAVLRNLQTMAESTQRLSESTRQHHPEIEWRQIAAFRNVLVHDYLGIDLERVWEIVHRDVPALCKLGFTVPVPRQEDHFGVDFIVHLARKIDQTIAPSGKSFGIQIKSNEAPLVFDEQHKRDCLYGSSLPFFLGVVSRQNLTLTVYNTLNRLSFYWMFGTTRNFTLTVKDTGDGIPKPDFGNAIGGTGKPILEIGISEPTTPQGRSCEIEILQSTMRSWIDLENENLSLKEQGIALLFWPSTYTKNKPLGEGIERRTCPHTKFAGPDSLPNICKATEKTLTSLSFYLRRLPADNVPENVANRMSAMYPKADSLRDECEALRGEWEIDTGPSASPSSSAGR